MWRGDAGEARRVEGVRSHSNLPGPWKKLIELGRMLGDKKGRLEIGEVRNNSMVTPDMVGW